MSISRATVDDDMVLRKDIVFDLRLTADQAQAPHLRKETNQQATQEAREIARNGGPGYVDMQAMLEAMEKNPSLQTKHYGRIMTCVYLLPYFFTKISRENQLGLFVSLTV